MKPRTIWILLAGVALLTLPILAWNGGNRPVPSAHAAGPMGEVALVYAPGGVLTRDGTVWQYRPDKGKWMTVDESFREEGRETHVQPLPVPASEIAQMESFGFLATRTGQCWLYDLEKDRWVDVGTPPARR